MRTVIVLALALAAASVSTSSNANEITISQIGDRLSMDIVQDGEDHVIKKKTTTSKIDGDDVTFIVRQTKNDNILEYDQLTGDDNYIGISIKVKTFTVGKTSGSLTETTTTLA